MALVLVIDDDSGLRSTLDHTLAQDRHERLYAETGAQGLVLARSEQPDIILLEALLSDQSDGQVCRSLQASEATHHIPFVFVTHKGAEADRIRGFELGASDYVVKPFSPRELGLRIRAVLRRAEFGPRAECYDFGRLRIEPSGHRAWVDGQSIELTNVEFKLLRALYEGRNRVQSRSELLDRAWGADVSVSSRTVDTHVKRLREKLRDAGGYVQTVRGLGYRFAREK